MSAHGPCDMRIGTSGYDYPEWSGSFYPRGLGRKDFLPFYVAHFDTVELNFSYYGMPRAEQLARLLEASGPHCLFSIKANRSLTHEIDPDHWRESLVQYRESLDPLLPGRRLGAVLLEFPQSFHYEPERRRYLDELIRGFGEIPLVVEFRNMGWYNNRVFDALRERRVGIASLDVPKLHGLPPVIDLVTAPTAYIRFHGRNAEAWWGTGAAARYDYLYSKEELQSWLERVKGIADKAERLLIYFNNHFNGQAIKNAAMLKELLANTGSAP
ncbi:MAG TPA: DUF72 domain-containing protein [Rectinemataceae bacterium]|nr:DUF72 domain-containing protein [Rectinemataceae bacterium]